MRAQAFPIFVFFLLVSLVHGCADRQILPPLTANATLGSREPVRIRDPEGPIPAPALPPELAAISGTVAATTAQSDPKGYPYSVECSIKEPPVREQTNAPGASPPDKSSHPAPKPSQTPPIPETDVIISVFKQTSVLYRLIDSPPETVTGLEQRLSVALTEARDILHSQGYYSGRVTGMITPPTGKDEDSKAVVRVTFIPGPLYRMGKTEVSAELPASGEETRKLLPTTLADAGLAQGAPALASEVLAAVDRARDVFMDNGYPSASVASTLFTADHATRTLEAKVRITCGPFVRMGDIERHGAPNVRDSYIEAQRTWKKGRPWSQSRVESFRDSLRQGGLFQSIEVEPAPEDDDAGRRPVMTTLSGAPERTISGTLKYHSDFGPGLQGNWEHRNLTGRGDQLRFSLPVWMDMQEFTAGYRLPHFLKRNQDFIAKAGFLNQDTDAYRLTSAAGSAGIERKLSRSWSMTLQGSVEGGRIKEPEKKSRDYIMFGLPLSLTYDTTGSLLNAVKGQRLLLSLSPYNGKYDGNFTVLRSRLEAQAFIPLAEEDKVVLALRGTIGMVDGADSGKIPPSIRFYSGGGGSVRGYEYQSLGPRNKDRDPLGGGSLAEVSAETRLKITPEWGLVAFVDGGTAYENVFSDPNQEMHWGAGLGVRYYTAIGPVRFDLATPLNPRSDDDSLQFYISIGQSF